MGSLWVTNVQCLLKNALRSVDEHDAFEIFELLDIYTKRFRDKANGMEVKNDKEDCSTD